ncbi:MAG: hypothetical protein QM535_07535 [Limnohabitans sp.]|nr:hypothetical protein [Limnohabitans sp.]
MTYNTVRVKNSFPFLFSGDIDSATFNPETSLVTQSRFSFIGYIKV